MVADKLGGQTISVPDVFSAPVGIGGLAKCLKAVLEYMQSKQNAEQNAAMKMPTKEKMQNSACLQEITT